MAFALNGDVIMGDVSGRISVWVKDNSEAYTIDRRTSDGLRHAHEVSATDMPGDVYGNVNLVKIFQRHSNIDFVVLISEYNF